MALRYPHFCIGRVGGRILASTLLLVHFSSPSLSQEKQIPPAATSPVNFESDIAPLFTEKCLSCHGPDKRRSGFRIDTHELALEGGNSGPSLIPGKSAESLLVQYISGTDPDVVMPPEGDPLTPEQVGLVRAWIDAGAEWPEGFVLVAGGEAAKGDHTKHWSFLPPVRHAPPEVQNPSWVRNPIDAFVLSRLDEAGLTPSPPADRYTLIRRASLDLTGLPPTPEEAEAFALDSSPDAYEKVVDRLLNSPHYGERWARNWLDLARYADTNGYEKDRVRSIWPYRDWVVDALNSDMPFDRFTIEQIAGDMLPESGLSQKIATGFHRNTMTNEEGGIDVEQFRYESVVDRVRTTGTAFLGLTIGCAQCHDHKYDPISQREYFQLFAFLNGTDEPMMRVPIAELTAKRSEILSRIDSAKNLLEAEFPPFEEKILHTILEPSAYSATGGAILAKIEDQSLLAVGPSPATSTYSMVYETSGTLNGLRIEALNETRLLAPGPGRAQNGNFVLSEIRITAEPLKGTEGAAPVPIALATASFEQPGYPGSAAIDGLTTTGWAVDDGSGDMRKDRTIDLEFGSPVAFPGGVRLKLVLDQNFGGEHTLNRFRVSSATKSRTHYRPELPEEQQRALHLADKLESWRQRETAKSSRWTVVRPESTSSHYRATMQTLEDDSVLVSGDYPNRDVYHVRLVTDASPITAIRLEALPHESLPNNGPGRGVILGEGNFMLSEFEVAARPRNASDEIASVTLELSNPSATHSPANHTVDKALDGILDTGWAIEGGEGKRQVAVFPLAQPLAFAAGTVLDITLDHHYIHQQTLGRFRLSVTSDPIQPQASSLPAEVETILAKDNGIVSDAEGAQLKQYYLEQVAPDLETKRLGIRKLESDLPEYPLTLVMEERKDARKTHIHVRGEFLRTGIEVAPAAPAFLHPIPEGKPLNRLTFAEWLVAPENPLVGRVVMNRLWQTYFGRGLVLTSEDFGTRCAPPTHPELLDWLATEFMNQGWSLKAMHRLIMTSSTFRQSSRFRPELVEKDPENTLLARGPRFRVEGEMVRDIALAASGLLVPGLGGPPVFPPQPPGVTEIAYGAPKWNISEGEDRYRRSLYTHIKRSVPYATFATFDAPTPNMECARRMVSNTPLQALTTLNDEAFVETAQALARRVVLSGAPTDAGRAEFAFRACLTRAPLPGELDRLLEFRLNQLERFKAEPERATTLACGPNSAVPEGVEVADLAAWTAVCRVLLNLDETVTKE